MSSWLKCRGGICDDENDHCACKHTSKKITLEKPVCPLNNQFSCIFEEIYFSWNRPISWNTQE